MDHPIALYRSALDQTQEALAKLLGTTPATISRIESGLRQPSVALTLKIEQVTGIPRAKLRPDVYPEIASAA